MSSVYFGGSRFLGQCPQLAPLVSAVQAAGQVVHVGCCVGADQQVIQAANPSFLVVFAIGGRSGGWCSFSAERQVWAAAAAGAQVRPWAGGFERIPLKARLIRRSYAALAGCSSAVFFQPGTGSLKVIEHAIKLNIPVFVFGSQPAPMCGGYFQLVLCPLAPFACWQFQPAQSGLF